MRGEHMQNQQQNGRMIWLDTLRLTAGVSMVGLHASSDAMGQPFADFPVEDRIWPLLIRAVIYTARTELFLIISIFLLLMALDKRPRGYGTVITQQARRLLLPFVFWTIFYAFYNLNKASVFNYDTWVWSQLMTPSVWVDYFLLGTSKYHMHFLPTLFGMVLIYPLYRLGVRYPALGLTVIAGLMIKREVDVYLWVNHQDTTGFWYMLRGVKIATYAGYGMVAGAAVGLWQRKADLNRFTWWIVAAGLGLFGIKLIATWKTALAGAWQHNYTPGYWADFLMPVVLFLICMSLAHKVWPSFISKIAKYSFGIYLCHPIFLDLIEIALKGRELMPVELVLIKIAFGIGATTCFVLILERLRPLAWTIGLGEFPRLKPNTKLEAAQ